MVDMIKTVMKVNANIDVRNSRLFDDIWELVNLHSQVEKIIREESLNDGKADFQFIKTFGDLKRDDTGRIHLTAEWVEATFIKVGISLNSDSVFK